MSTISGFRSLFILIILLSACTAETRTACRKGVQIPCVPREEPHLKLSDYNFYNGPLNNLNPVDDLLPYDLNTSLFTDYARKIRFVYVPKETSVRFWKKGIPDFPVGSVLVKNFYYKDNLQNPYLRRRILETRLLIRQENGWNAETYVWNDQQSEAFLTQVGDQKNITWTDSSGRERQSTYLIPAKNDCKTCHNQNGRLVPIGPKLRNLNKIYSYPEGKVNQLVKWANSGLLQAAPDPDEIFRLPVWDDPSTGTVKQRARAYLDINCSHCHNTAGSAGYSGLFLNYSEENPYRLGVFKPPVAAGAGSGGLRFDIVPGRPDSSILLYRMKSKQPAIRMPELDRTQVHKEAVELIEIWIRGIDSF